MVVVEVEVRDGIDVGLEPSDFLLPRPSELILALVASAPLSSVWTVWVWSRLNGDTITNMSARHPSLRESLRVLVSAESYVTWVPAASAVITLLRPRRSELMATPSRICVPVAPPDAVRSDPARSIRFNVPVIVGPSRFKPGPRVIWNVMIRCDREDCSFMLVDAVARYCDAWLRRSVASDTFAMTVCTAWFRFRTTTFCPPRGYCSKSCIVS